jgi:hypothetical protein
MRGDPDDLGTAALAEFLSPAVVISKDSVFNRFGLALPAGQWTEEVQRLLTAAGYEAELQGAAGAAELAARGIFAGIGAVSKAAARNPKATIAVIAVIGIAIWLCSRRAWLTAEKVRKAGRGVISAAKPIADRVVIAAEGQAEALGALTVVQRSSRITLEERCARHLAMRHTAMTPSELRDALSTYDRPVTAAAVRRAVRAHPAFARQPGDKYILGRPFSLPALDGGADAHAAAPAAPPQFRVIPPPAFLYAVPPMAARPARVRGENDR